MSETDQQSTASAGQRNGAGEPPRRRGRPPHGQRLPKERVRRTESKQLVQERRFGYALVAPAVIVLLAVTVYPLLYNLWNSFHNDQLTPGHPGRLLRRGQLHEDVHRQAFLPPCGARWGSPWCR